MADRRELRTIPSTPKSKVGLVLHTCDNEWCVEPKHLYFGSQKDNVRDMYERHPTIREKISNASIGRKIVWPLAARKAKSTIGNKNRLGGKKYVADRFFV